MIDELQLKAIEEWGQRDIPREYGETVVALCADHRALTAQVDALQGERDRLKALLHFACREGLHMTEQELEAQMKGEAL